MDLPADLYLEERRQQILKLLDGSGRVSVTELAQRFGVSEVTIRSDLRSLAERNLVVRTHGGAVPTARAVGELSLAIRSQQRVAEKERIGSAAAEMVSDGDAIILDSSSTTLEIARRLKRRHDLTIVTNSLAIALEMHDAPGITVAMPGGTLRRDMSSLVGGNGVEMFDRFNIRKGFFGAHGITVPEGLTDVSAEEAEVKRPLVAKCHEVIAVLDATKWGRVGLASFADLSVLRCVITDKEAPADMVGQVQALGIQVVLV
jgi:DeoR family transcriptional regulator of aga operon